MKGRFVEDTSVVVGCLDSGGRFGGGVPTIYKSHTAALRRYFFSNPNHYIEGKGNNNHRQLEKMW